MQSFSFCLPGLTILGTSIYGGAIIAVCVDYFIEKFIMMVWVWDRIRLSTSIPVCWFSWLVLGVWPFMILIGSLTQWKITGLGTHHQESECSLCDNSCKNNTARLIECGLEHFVVTWVDVLCCTSACEMQLWHDCFYLFQETKPTQPTVDRQRQMIGCLKLVWWIYYATLPQTAFYG